MAFLCPYTLDQIARAAAKTASGLWAQIGPAEAEPFQSAPSERQESAA
jgi:hypothetical protein